MKKTCFAAAMAMILMVVMTVAASAATVFVSNEGGSLNLRQGPGKEHESVGFVQHGDSIGIINRGGVWTEVQTEDGATGYIKTMYIEGLGDIYASDTDYDGYGYTAYTIDRVNFRAGASTTAAVIKTFEKDERVTVLGRNDDYYLVETADGEQGFLQWDRLTTRPGAQTKVVTGDTEMREQGGESSERIRYVFRGNIVEVIYVGNYWTKVRGVSFHEEQEGWIKNSYLE